MKNKKYLSIFLWLSFVVLIVSYLNKDNKEKQSQAIKETQEAVLKAHKKIYKIRFDKKQLLISSMGNNPMDRAIQDTIKIGGELLNSMFAEGRIENQRILPFLSKYYYSRETVDDTEKILQDLEEYKGSNQTVKQVNLVSRYQTSLYHLYNHYNKLGSACNMRFTETLIMNVSDTTLGFAFMGFYDDYVVEPDTRVWWITGDSKKLIGIKTETYLGEDTIKKMYKVIPSKSGKPNPFDYKEIDFE